MNKLAVLGAFIAGVAVGSAVTWYVTNNEYEEVYEYVPNNHEEVEDEIKEIAKEKLEEIIKENDYTDYSSVRPTSVKSVEKEKEEEKDVNKPYVISPDEFDEKGYNVVTLTLYNDGVLVNDVEDEVIEEDSIDKLVGKESLKTFGKYEEDTVFVRNDKLKTDYEILLDTVDYLDSDYDINE